MPKHVIVIISMVIFLLSVPPDQVQAAVTAQLSEILILPETPVRIKVPEIDQEIEVSSIRSISPDTQIIAEQPVKILCPDFSVIEVPPGDSFTCPPPEREVTLMVEVPPPPPWLLEVSSIRGNEFASLTSEEQSQTRQADNEIQRLPVMDEQKLFLRASLYGSLHLYSEAQRLFNEYPEQLRDPASLRLRASIYWNDGNLRRAFQYFSRALERSQTLDDTEGQALALHALAALLNVSKENELAAEMARKAQQAYTELGYSIDIERLLEYVSEE